MTLFHSSERPIPFDLMNLNVWKLLNNMQQLASTDVNFDKQFEYNTKTEIILLGCSPVQLDVIPPSTLLHTI